MQMISYGYGQLPLQSQFGSLEYNEQMPSLVTSGKAMVLVYSLEGAQPGSEEETRAFAWEEAFIEFGVCTTDDPPQENGYWFYCEDYQGK